MLFVGYVVLGHKISEAGASGRVERLGAAMAIASSSSCRSMDGGRRSTKVDGMIEVVVIADDAIDQLSRSSIDPLLTASAQGT